VNFRFQISILFSLGILLAACRTAPPLPPVNTTEAGWTVRQGQAVWEPHRGAQPLAGDLLVATRSDDESLVQFTKAPFPSIIAQTTKDQWQVQFFPQNRRAAGRGRPPRLIWFELVRSLTRLPPTDGWRFRIKPDNSWVLENPSTGESLEGFLSP
jgi:hypothetical protein